MNINQQAHTKMTFLTWQIGQHFLHVLIIIIICTCHEHIVKAKMFFVYYKQKDEEGTIANETDDIDCEQYQLDNLINESTTL